MGICTVSMCLNVYALNMPGGSAPSLSDLASFCANIFDNLENDETQSGFRHKGGLGLAPMMLLAIIKQPLFI